MAVRGISDIGHATFAIARDNGWRLGAGLGSVQYVRGTERIAVSRYAGQVYVVGERIFAPGHEFNAKSHEGRRSVFRGPKAALAYFESLITRQPIHETASSVEEAKDLLKRAAAFTEPTETQQ